MRIFLIKHAPLLLTIILSLIRVAASLITQGSSIMEEKDYKKRRAKALEVLLGALPLSLCHAAFSYDVWVITTLLVADPKTQVFYNLTGKEALIHLFLVIHVICYIMILGWSIVRGSDKKQELGDMAIVTQGRTTANNGSSNSKFYLFELFIAFLAILLCFVFQDFT